MADGHQHQEAIEVKWAVHVVLDPLELGLDGLLVDDIGEALAGHHHPETSLDHLCADPALLLGVEPAKYLRVGISGWSWGGGG